METNHNPDKCHYDLDKSKLNHKLNAIDAMLLWQTNHEINAQRREEKTDKLSECIIKQDGENKLIYEKLSVCITSISNLTNKFEEFLKYEQKKVDDKAKEDRATTLKLVLFLVASLVACGALIYQVNNNSIEINKLRSNR